MLRICVTLWGPVSGAVVSRRMKLLRQQYAGTFLSSRGVVSFLREIIVNGLSWFDCIYSRCLKTA